MIVHDDILVARHGQTIGIPTEMIPTIAEEIIGSDVLLAYRRQGL